MLPAVPGGGGQHVNSITHREPGPCRCRPNPHNVVQKESRTCLRA
ncbi:hypothetical protein HMPREF1549_01765 [Actinomyces johnsonii F0510]|uniref:Uncharacterized protein n=1 Tax=Actinomyces johnsonii F0510 TaxID=1227262 RepID=U1Q8J1_9ACTO|nr:hypothetical protein HMPREF1549_01765 [Actinomyces johnsonii F0510]